jgi:hypothetical protein
LTLKSGSLPRKFLNNIWSFGPLVLSEDLEAEFEPDRGDYFSVGEEFEASDASVDLSSRSAMESARQKLLVE